MPRIQLSARVEALRAVVADRFVRFRRFLQRPVETPTGAFWETTSDFDLEHHVAQRGAPANVAAT